MYLDQSDAQQLNGLISSLKKAVKKVVQPVKHLQTKAPEVKKLTKVAAMIPGPWQAVTVPVAAAVQFVPEKKAKLKASGAPAVVTSTPSPAADIKKLLPIAAAGVATYFMLR